MQREVEKREKERGSWVYLRPWLHWPLGPIHAIISTIYTEHILLSILARYITYNQNGLSLKMRFMEILLLFKLIAEIQIIIANIY